MKPFTLIGVLLLSFLIPPATNARTPEQKGHDIAAEHEARDLGWQDTQARVRMVLRNRHGQESIRQFRYRALEMVDQGAKTDGDRVLIVFDTPRDVKGTALLTFTHMREDDDQWLYLPALKRVKRISASNKSGSFVGSEFAYEDITSEEIDKYTYRWAGDESLDDTPCFVVDRYPVDRHNSGYTRQVVWYDKDEYRIRRIDYYDRKESLLKTLVFKDYEQHLDRHWRPGAMHMVNHQSGKSTLLVWSDYHFQTGLSKQDFAKTALNRTR